MEEHFPTLWIALHDDILCRSFYCYLRDKNLGENYLDFWLSAEEYKCAFQDSSNEDRESSACDIYTMFFEDRNPPSPSHLNMEISHDLQEEKSQDSFTAAQQFSFELLRKPFNRFLNSTCFQALSPIEDHASLRMSKRTKKPKKPKPGTRIEKLIKKCAQRGYISSKDESSDVWMNERLRSASIEEKLSNNNFDLFHTLSEEQTILLRQVLTNILLAPPYSFVLLLVELSDAEGRKDTIIQAIIDIYIHHDSMTQILLFMFEKELSLFQCEERLSTDKENTILRGDSIATNMMTKYLGRMAHSYLSHIILPTVEEIAEYPNGLEVKEDHEKNIDTKANFAVLLDITKKLLSRIETSQSSCPRAIKQDLAAIFKLAEEKLGEGLKVIGSVFFLRFICPAITAPYTKDLTEVPVREIKRVHVLVGKILQSLVNDAELDGSKEEYMKGANPFIADAIKQRRIQKFISILLDDEDVGLSITHEEVQYQAYKAEQTITSFVTEHFTSIWEKVIENHPEIAISFSPFFKVGLDSASSSFSANSLGHN